jgi:nucleotide-binding universal stress UspA family protein
MPIRDMLVYVDHTEATRNALDRALGFAKSRDVRLTALYVDSWTVWVSGFGAEMSTAVIDAQREMAEKRKAEVRHRVERQADEAGWPVQWQEDEGEAANIVCRHAGGVDAVVLGHPWELAEFTDTALVNATAIGSGRPVLVIPRDFQQPVDFEHILVAWNGGREAARAVHDALPLLREADRVIAATVGPLDSYSGTDLPVLADHLRRHKVNVEEKPIADEGRPAGETLLATAADSNCGLIVMGCYGHSRLREWVLGGCTRHLLAHSGVPLWVAH